MKVSNPLFLALLATTPLACDPNLAKEDDNVASYEAPFSSAIATLLDFEFDGQLTVPTSANYLPAIRSQMFYTVGHLNQDGGVARLNRLVATSITATSIGGGLVRVSYHAKLPVVWPSKTSWPSSYTLTLPLRVDSTGQQNFLASYGATCSEPGETATLDNFWYHYRPQAYGCSLNRADVMLATATTRVSNENVATAYPEYHRIWQDGALNLVTIWSKYESGATDPNDAGIDAFNRFVHAIIERYPDAITTPASLPPQVGASTPDITFKFWLPDGRPVTLVALLINELRSEGAAFDKRYNSLSTAADAVLYNGHAGLGSNIAALAKKGQFLPNKYQIFFMNGCDTFAYSDDSMQKARAALNPGSDPQGTRFLDLVYNAMPAYFVSMPDASLALIDALVQYESTSAAKTFPQIFADVDAAQVVLSIGEEDNEFRNTSAFMNAAAHAVLGEEGAVGYKLSQQYTTTLAAGSYSFALDQDPAAQGGDADLRYKIGSGSLVRCTSLFKNTNEYCDFKLSQSSNVTLSVTGDASGMESFYVLRGFRPY